MLHQKLLKSRPRKLEYLKGFASRALTLIFSSKPHTPQLQFLQRFSVTFFVGEKKTH